MYRSGEGGEKSLLCDPGSQLRLGGREDRRAKIINGMEKKKKRVQESMAYYRDVVVKQRAPALQRYS